MQTKLVSGLIGLGLVACSFIVSAQQPMTVGDLLDKGGVKLSAEDQKQLLSGATVTGLQAGNNLPFSLTYKEGGTVEGHGSTAAIYVTGTWWVNDEGKVCTNMRNNNGMRLGACNYYLKLNDLYFTSLSDEKASTLLERQIKR